MGKLVLFLVDGTTRETLLGREHITIGRRPDNDLCLSSPAVSGEHAQVVTVLADSFLEDMGSTNGTRVNGKAITRHFLKDQDQINIGREWLVYLRDDHAEIEPLLPDLFRRQQRYRASEAASAKPSSGEGANALAVQHPAVQCAPAAASAPAKPSPAAETPPGVLPGGDPTVFSGGGVVSTDGALPNITPQDIDSLASKLSPLQSQSLSANGAGSDADGGNSAAAPAAPTAPAAPAGSPAIRVLSGASSGRRVPLTGAELTVGRVGTQVAVVRKVDDGYRLVPLEGSEPLRINDVPIPPVGGILRPGDVFEVAGVRLQFFADA
jgi:hypothetical protein